MKVVALDSSWRMRFVGRFQIREWVPEMTEERESKAKMRVLSTSISEATYGGERGGTHLLLCRLCRFLLLRRVGFRGRRVKILSEVVRQVRLRF